MTVGRSPLLRFVIVTIGLIALWQAIVTVTGLPSFIVPGPRAVFSTLIVRHEIILGHAAITVAEILIGLAVGVALGAANALVFAAYPSARNWLLPLFVMSQAIPTFALAPLLVLWLGYGMASKIAMAVLFIYFPVTASFWDGLRRTDPGWLDLAHTMNASPGATLLRIRLPAALPSLASGIRVAASAAPAGAIVGEWVGSSAGLGYLMLQANGRMQIDVVFAALLVVTAISVALYFAVDLALRRILPWQPDRDTP